MSACVYHEGGGGVCRQTPQLQKRPINGLIKKCLLQTYKRGDCLIITIKEITKNWRKYVFFDESSVKGFSEKKGIF